MYNDMLLLLDIVMPPLQSYTYIHTYLTPRRGWFNCSSSHLCSHSILADHVSSHDTPDQSRNLSHWLPRPTTPRISVALGQSGNVIRDGPWIDGKNKMCCLTVQPPGKEHSRALLTDRPVSKEGHPCVTGVNHRLLWWGEAPGTRHGPGCS